MPDAILTNSKFNLLFILLQINLDACFKEVQFCFQLLGKGGHRILHLRKSTIIPQQIHPVWTRKGPIILLNCKHRPTLISKADTAECSTRHRIVCVRGRNSQLFTNC